MSMHVHTYSAGVSKRDVMTGLGRKEGEKSGVSVVGGGNG